LGRKDGLLADHVTDVVFRPGGMVVATPAGLSFVGADGIRSLYAFQGLVNNHVYALASAGDRIAAGTLGGLSLLKDDAIQASYTTANSALKHNWISAVARVGDEWYAGTYGAGVMRLDAAGQWHTFPEFRGDIEVNPNAMTVEHGMLYVGTLGQGLWIDNLATGRWTNTMAGLPSTNVTAIAAGNGSVFVGTDNGLVRYGEGDLR
jgi:ligand-binding sensor domain-containing protein